jgi:hypothetical protein
MNRRAFLAAALVLTLGSSCKKRETPRDRCTRCGMKIDPASAWRVELILPDGAAMSFDTPRCALYAWRSGQVEATAIRVHEYYDQKMRDGTELRFVVGGDVAGPMGPDFVPVDPARVTKFIQDHGAERAFRLDELTLQTLDQH